MGRRLRFLRALAGSSPAARRRPSAEVGGRGGAVSESRVMEITWFGRSCMRLKGRDAVVVSRPLFIRRRADRTGDLG